MKAGDRRDDEGPGDPRSQLGIAAWAPYWVLTHGEPCSPAGTSVWCRGFSEATRLGAGLVYSGGAGRSRHHQGRLLSCNRV